MRKMPRSVRRGAEDSPGRARRLHAPLLLPTAAEQEWHLGDKIWTKELPSELGHAPRSEITGVINTPVPEGPPQLLQPG